MKTLHLNLTTLKSKLLSIILLVCLVSISSLLSSCDKEDVEPEAPQVAPNSKPETDELVHLVPEVPILLDGVSAPPTDVLKYNGQPLIYFLDENFEKDGIVRIFTSEEKANTYQSQIKSKDTNSADDITSAARSAAKPKIKVYSEIGYGGKERTFELGNPKLLDLSSIGNGSWNNSISSIKCSQMPNHWTILYNGSGYQGNRVRIESGTNVNNLKKIKFNDKTSSIGFKPES